MSFDSIFSEIDENFMEDWIALVRGVLRKRFSKILKLLVGVIRLNDDCTKF